MKKRFLILVIMVLLLALTSCELFMPCEVCVDKSGDGICDICRSAINDGDVCTEHSYDNECDSECNLCGELRNVSHSYDNACDGECNVCGAARVTEHTYDNACDPVCNICGDTRSAGHTYDDECDGECNICGDVRGAEHADTDHNKLCDNCGASLEGEIPALTKTPLDLSALGPYTDKQVIEINDNSPEFTEKQYTVTSYEYYGARDSLGRCTIAVACIGTDLMPTGSRGSISSVSPTGWHSSAIYERCHLIAFSLTGENANWENLITGTYDLNGVMQTYEEMVCSYIKETGNHVLYRATPVFDGDDLLASGVQLEAWSIEDNGDGICFNVFIYNVETDYEIDYTNGDYELSDESELHNCTFVINKKKGKFHLPTCSSVTDMNDENKLYSYDTYEELVDAGYSPCGNCLKNYNP